MALAPAAQITAATGSEQLINSVADADGNYGNGFLLQNNGAVAVRVGKTTTTTSGIRVLAGDTLTVANITPGDQWYVRAESSTALCDVQQWGV